MIRTAMVAAVAAATFALAVPGTAEARMANPGLAATFNAETPAGVQQAHYTGYRHSHRRHYRHHSRRYRHCWNERVRVRVPGGYFVWRTHRRCGWRGW